MAITGDFTTVANSGTGTVYHSGSSFLCIVLYCMSFVKNAAPRSTKRTPSSSRQNITCSRHDIAEKLFPWR